MRVNTAITNIMTGNVPSHDDLVACLAVAVDPTKRLVLEGALNGTFVVAQVTAPKVVESKVKAAPAAPVNRSKLGRTDEQKVLSSLYFEAAKAGTLGTIVTGKGKKAAKVVVHEPTDDESFTKVSYQDACTLSGIPTTKNGLVNA